MRLSNWTYNSDRQFINTDALYSKPFTIVLLDDHKIFRYGLKKLIETKFSTINFIEFGNGDEAYEFLYNAITNNKLPHLLITDITHSGLNGVELINKLRILENKIKNKNRLSIMLITMHAKEDVLNKQTTLLGMVDFIYPKSVNVDWLLGCVDEVLGID